MAKSKSGQSKADSIRQLLGEDPATPTKEIIASLAKKGMPVNANHVYLIKSKMKQRKHRLKRERMTEAARVSGVANPVRVVMKVKDLAMEVGGIKQLKQLVDLLAD